MIRPLDHARPYIDLSEPCEIAWRVMLTEFDEQVWPIYERHGYSKDAALQVWMLSKLHDRLDRIEDMIADERGKDGT